MELGRVPRYVEAPGNGFVRRSFRQQPQHLQFPRSASTGGASSSASLSTLVVALALR